MREVFISYKSRKNAPDSIDEIAANKLCEAIEASGITCWIAPRDIEPGEREYEEAIMDAIDNCQVLLIVYSCHSRKSRDMKYELKYADEKDKIIIPFIIDGSELVGVFHFRLSSVHRITANENDYQEKIPELITALQHKLKIHEPHDGFSEDNEDSDKSNKAEAVQPNPSKKQIKKDRVSNEIEKPSKGKAEDNEREVPSGTQEVSTIETIIANDVSFNMVLVEGDKFMMGATADQGGDAYNIEKPPHQVMLSTYYIGETQVTQELWQVVMGNNPSHFKGDLKRPVERVSWDDCNEFIYRLNKLTHRRFRLPTEAEWEYAARGGRKSRSYKYAGSNDPDEVAWYEDNSEGTTHPVCGKKANELGLFDMSGNVYEWCRDWYGIYSNDAQTDPKGPFLGSYHSARGGCWMHNIRRCRVSSRDAYIGSNKHSYLGLRLVLDYKRK